MAVNQSTETGGASRAMVGGLAPARTDRVLIMAALNVTPDSFSDGGDYFNPATAVARAGQMIAEGADILDIGAESTRPGGEPIDAETEQQRLQPVLEAVGGHVSVPLSIDTYRASTARFALERGATIVNDVWGFTREPEIAQVTAEFEACAVIGHWETGVSHLQGDALMAKMVAFFRRQIDAALAAGVQQNRISIDPGIGFGKTPAQNLVVIHKLGHLVELGFPVLVGASRKRFIGEITGREPKNRLPGSLAAHMLAAVNGAAAVRVHDVAAHDDALRVMRAIETQQMPVQREKETR